ncbi:hypothetical protein B0T16DRAFT_455691 [Cercophora newfieldiana]|uniref:Uncharacterized protein n=1 Tax=Cercophora newfieldiana TaxID=92897 RepID=A0AA40CR73_9PEZI|nr:hypothetical protein B0T16DRAFT_455691 [Cercophora newfieldiana]
MDPCTWCEEPSAIITTPIRLCPGCWEFWYTHRQDCCLSCLDNASKCKVSQGSKLVPPQHRCDPCISENRDSICRLATDDELKYFRLSKLLDEIPRLPANLLQTPKKRKRGETTVKNQSPAESTPDSGKLPMPVIDSTADDDNPREKRLRELLLRAHKAIKPNNLQHSSPFTPSKRLVSTPSKKLPSTPSSSKKENKAPFATRSEQPTPTRQGKRRNTGQNLIGDNGPPVHVCPHCSVNIVERIMIPRLEEYMEWWKSELTYMNQILPLECYVCYWLDTGYAAFSQGQRDEIQDAAMEVITQCMPGRVVERTENDWDSNYM